MKRKLYSNMRRMTALFSVAILCVTLSALTLRLTVFGDIELGTSGGGGGGGSMVERVENEQFNYSIANRVNFRTPQSRGNFRIENPAENDYYMSVSIILPETGEELFYTGFIRPGESRGENALHLQTLPPGEHECIARVTVYDPETLRPRGSEERPIILYIG